MDYKNTKCVLFSKTSKYEFAELNIATNSGLIETSSVVKYLGAFFDKKLSWKLIRSLYLIKDFNRSVVEWIERLLLKR